MMIRRGSAKVIDDDILDGENLFLDVTVYSFEVEGFRTYYAGAGSIWVGTQHQLHERHFVKCASK